MLTIVQKKNPSTFEGTLVVFHYNLCKQLLVMKLGSKIGCVEVIGREDQQFIKVKTLLHAIKHS